MRVPSWLTAATGPLYRERVSRGYLYAVAASIVLLLLDTAVFSHRSASLTGMVVLILTLPWTPALWALFAAIGGMDTRTTAFGWSGWALTILAALVSAAINAFLLGYAARYARRRAESGPHASGTGSGERTARSAEPSGGRNTRPAS